VSGKLLIGGGGGGGGSLFVVALSELLQRGAVQIECQAQVQGRYLLASRALSGEGALGRFRAPRYRQVQAQVVGTGTGTVPGGMGWDGVAWRNLVQNKCRSPLCPLFYSQQRACRQGPGTVLIVDSPLIRYRRELLYHAAAQSVSAVQREQQSKGGRSRQIPGEMVGAVGCVASFNLAVASPEEESKRETL
jgi:hypothetical protein